MLRAAQVPILGTILFDSQLTASSRASLLGFYLPYFVVPLWMLVHMGHAGASPSACPLTLISLNLVMFWTPIRHPWSSLSPWSSLREVLQKATQAVAYWCKPYAAVLAFRAVLSRSAILRATPRTPHHPPCQRRITHPAKDASRRAETRKNRPPHVRMCVHHATGLPACRAPLRLWCFPQAGYKEPIKPE